MRPPRPVNDKNKLPAYQAFTVRSKGRLPALLTNVGVTMDSIPDPLDPGSAIHQTTGLWDTGATHSCITADIARSLGLQAISMTNVFTASGPTRSSVYLVNLYLPNGIVVPRLRVTECDNTAGHFGMLIGMDVIGLGDMSLTHVNGATVFSFRVPSIQEMDYTRTPYGGKMPQQHKPSI